MSQLEIHTLLSDGRMIRSSDLEIYGLHRISLIPLVNQGVLYSPSRGVYIRSDVVQSPFFDLAVLSLRIPSGVWGLSTALAFHIEGFKNTSLWMRLLKGKKRYPTIAEYEISYLSRSQKMFYCGTMSQTIHGVDVEYTDFANSVAECCVFRNRIGMEMFLFALTSYVHSKYFDETYFSNVCRLHRVEKVIHPYTQTVQKLL